MTRLTTYLHAVPARWLRAVSVATVTVLCAFGAVAEVHYKPHITVGGHAGMTMSRMSFAPSVGQNWLNGCTFGAHVSYTEEKIFGLVGELNVTQRGWKESFTDRDDLQFQRTLTYISLPVMTHIYFGPRRFKFFINLGPEFSVMIGDKRKSNFDYANPGAAGIPAGRHCEQMTMEIKNNFDYGITAGIGGQYWVSPRNAVHFEVRFYYGLGSIYGSSKSDVFSASRAMNLAATLGYSFRVK